MAEAPVALELSDGIATLTIQRESSLNALNADVMALLDQFISEISENSELHGVIVTGAGEKAFVAGADISELAAIEEARGGREMVARGQTVLGRLEDLRVPVIACVNGFALGGGLELALACHIRYGVKTARFGLPEVTLGLIPGYGGTQRLARLVGRGVATEMIVTGDHWSADEAHRVGLLNRLFETKEEMLAAAQKTLGKLGKKCAPLAVRAGLEAIARGLDGELDAGLRIEADLFGLLCGTNDMQEGTAAFLEKRKASYTGR